MRWMSVPCGRRSTSVLPAIICFCVSGLSPMWLTIARRTSPALISLPMPTPGIAVSLAITVSPPVPRRTSSSMRRSGVPTPMNPPIITEAPSGTRAAACSSDSVFMAARPAVAPSLREPSAVHRQRDSTDLGRRVRAQERDGGADLLRGGELFRRLLFGKKPPPGLRHRQVLAGGEVVDLLRHERSEHPSRTDRVARHSRGGRLERHDLGEPDDAVLGGDVRRLVDRGHEPMR